MGEIGYPYETLMKTRNGRDRLGEDQGIGISVVLKRVVHKQSVWVRARYKYIWLGHGPLTGPCEHSNETCDYIKGGNILRS
jgi:hypothetical protein